MRAPRWWLLLLSVVALVSSCAVRYVEAAATIEPPLKWHHYQDSCHDAETYVRHQVEFYWKRDRSLAPKLIQMLYCDCFITGCDASILLDGPNSEKAAPQNAGILGFPMVVIDKIKEVLEQRCPGVVSCADILNLAARDATHLVCRRAVIPHFNGEEGRDVVLQGVGGPPVGDRLVTASWKAALAYFQSRGLDVLDLTTLLGGHSMGKTNCSFITDRLYNFNNTGEPDPSMDSSFLAQMREQCPPNSKNQVYLDPDSGSSYSFSKSFYSRVLNHRAVLGIDQQIAGNNDSSLIAQEYRDSFEDFREMWALSMYHMGNIKVLTGDQGQIRKNCRVVNGK